MTRFLGYLLPKEDSAVEGMRFAQPMRDDHYVEFESLIRVTSQLRPFIIDFMAIEENFLAFDLGPKEAKSHFEAMSNPLMEGAIGSARRLARVQNLLSNFLFATSAFRDRAETRLREQFGEGAAECAVFKAAISAAYDGALEYRVFYNLRNYAQHHDIPLSLVPIQSNLNDQSKIEARVSVVLAPAKLAASSRVQQKVKDNDLAKMTGDIDLVAGAKVFYRLHAGLLKMILEMRRQEIADMTAYRDAVLRLLKLPHGAFPVIWEGDFPMETDVTVNGRFTHFSFDELNLIFVLREHLERVAQAGGATPLP